MTVEDRQGGDPALSPGEPLTDESIRAIAAADDTYWRNLMATPYTLVHVARSLALAAATPALSEDRLRTALEPFARLIDHAEGGWGSAGNDVLCRVDVKAGDIRAAVSALAAADSRPAELDAAWPVELTEFLRRGGKVSLYPPFGDETFTGQSVIQVEFGRGGASRYARQSVEGDTPVAVLRALAARIAETPR